jgi:hypothetical protein
LYYGPSPAHFLKNLYYREPYFGDLRDDGNFRELLRAALKLCTVHFAPWDIDWTVESLLAEYGERPRDSLFVMDFMMEKYVLEQGRQRYISKENFLFEFALDIAARLPGARFIYLYRDARDVIASQCKRHGGAGGVYRFAKLWEYEQTRAIRVHEILAAKGRSVAVSYEQLVADEDTVVRRLLEFLGTDAIVSGEGLSERVDVVVQEWRNLGRQTITDNFGKYRSELSRRQLALVEGVCRLQMRHLGYRPVVDEVEAPARRDILLDRFVQVADQIRVGFVRGPSMAPVVRDRSRLLRSLYVNYRHPDG